ncbi:hypothetical protein GCM10010106_41050 [Thermopolyspora flexuosa]|jgi:hypothetical protein|uniref:Uncharacterized protein n=1 Tax=Thermopolyspora flexuosa TaxID=103836 RepID=A0A543IUH0_9ACTN|nr:hypothetical protein [Thermopolyspora flexuosa]PZN41522.1 MAG: hypothetical protein DIU60_16880 [Actinomycetota bacterium]TQM74215.1 hypothetical protein FHX40_0880 [Thermopolyspora flexuosa]GGM89416.1 hypothetical protein GCM10010106_41050 [Thermopolyspora flexuosa]
MARDMSAPAVLRLARDLGVVPSNAEVTRRGGVNWVSGELEYFGWVMKRVPGRLTWGLNVGDAKFGPLMSEYGRMVVWIRGPRDEFPVPKRPDDHLIEWLQEGLGKAKEFVADRKDLCVLFASPEDVWRGDLYAWLPPSNYPARLVKALVLARDIGNPEMEAQVMGRLRRERKVDPRTGELTDVMTEARSWARQFSAVLGFDIPLQ